jgi:hypothetical protein
MADSITWETDLELARSMAREQEKTVLVDFYNPG